MSEMKLVTESVTSNLMTVAKAVKFLALDEFEIRPIRLLGNETLYFACYVKRERLDNVKRLFSYLTVDKLAQL